MNSRLHRKAKLRVGKLKGVVFKCLNNNNDKSYDLIDKNKILLNIFFKKKYRRQERA